ncbi:MAG: hypothetical protein CMP40_02205 [Rickettsiales bacterium]|nr:hypothetical protein [Rickettsiales bacterium]
MKSYKKNYRIWILLFSVANIMLFLLAIDAHEWVYKKNEEISKIEIITPEKEFNKIEAPKDKNFPNDESPLWNAFKNNKSNSSYSNNNKEISKEKKIDTKLDKEKKKKFIDHSINNNKNEKIGTVIKSEKEKIDITEQTNIISNNNSINKLVDEKKINIKKNDEEKQISNNESIDKSKPINNIKEKIYLYVQIASLSDDKAVLEEWKRFKRKFPNIFVNKEFIKKKVTLNDQRVFYRLFVGPFDVKNDAKIFCESIDFLKTCIIKKFNK